MIELTVRTLDSQNHQFTVEEDITVAQFKEKIAGTVNIPADTQRIIYCGRVLNDEAKLNEFDVNGKVVHLVERPPPAETQSANNIPVEPFDIVTPPPSQSLAASRLNVARRMLRRAEAIINLLENPTARPSDVAPQEEPQEEVTPVFEARVIVPGVNNEPLDDTFLDAVQDTIAQAAGRPEEASSAAAEAETNAASSPDLSPQGTSTTTTPEGTTPISSSTEDIAADVNREAQSSSNATNGNSAERASRPADMVELLDRLNRLQARFAPFMERYQNFMREDAAVEQQDVRSTQTMINRVSEVFHFLGHAYHSLSDIILRVRSAPPRSLSCIPILIQHSAVLQAGFPIQVEAQINFGPESASEAAAPAANNANGAAPPAANAAAPGGAPRPNISINPNILSFQTIPIGIRTMRPGSGGNRPPGNAPAGNAAPNATPSSNGTTNPNVELFMEVTPESITIDSLATTLLGGANTGEAGRGVPAGAPPPELFQTFVQMANQFVNRGNAAAAAAASTAASSQPTSESASNQSGQNSQARGNTQTNPTTSTHTRSTPRPHVHLSQHAMQGFDPFLPCSSHHISQRRRAHLRNQTATNNNNATRAPQTNGNTNNNFGRVYNIVQGVLSSLQNLYERRAATGTTVPPPGPAMSPPLLTPPHSSTQSPTNQPNLNQLFANFPNIVNLLPNSGDENNRGPTLAQLLGNEISQGEGIFNDLVTFLSQNLTIGDLVVLNAGRVDPFIRMRNDLRTFVLDRILEGSPPTTENIERGVDRLLEEMQPFFDHLSQLPVQGDIDLVRSVRCLIGIKLPNIILLAVSRSSNSVKQLYLKIRILMHQLCALILHSSRDGQRGVEDLLMNILSRYTEGCVPQDIQQWSMLAVRSQLQHFLSNLRVPASALQEYIIRNVDSVTASNAEPMETDEQEDQASGSSEVQINLSEAQEDLAAVVVGSEPWHGQVPPDWVPIISRDAQGQRRQNPQAPLSDAYLSGMPSKRRKIVTSPKPQGSLPQVIAESIRRAVVSTGLSSIGNVDEVAQEAGEDLNIQSAYRELLRTRVQSNVQDNEDFTPDRFPNASNYFNKQP